jgi:hypothetical protein
MGLAPPGYIPNPSKPGYYMPADDAPTVSPGAPGEPGASGPTGAGGGMGLAMLLSQMGGQIGRRTGGMFGRGRQPQEPSAMFGQAMQSAMPNGNEAGGFADDSIVEARKKALSDFMQRGQVGNGTGAVGSLAGAIRGSIPWLR